MDASISHLISGLVIVVYDGASHAATTARVHELRALALSVVLSDAVPLSFLWQLLTGDQRVHFLSFT